LHAAVSRILARCVFYCGPGFVLRAGFFMSRHNTEKLPSLCSRCPAKTCAKRLGPKSSSRKLWLRICNSATRPPFICLLRWAGCLLPGAQECRVECVHVFAGVATSTTCEHQLHSGSSHGTAARWPSLGCVVGFCFRCCGPHCVHLSISVLGARAEKKSANSVSMQACSF
jgi:hypothetical protein